MWMFTAGEARMPHDLADIVTVRRSCPFDAAGVMQRVAQRLDHAPYTWYPIGYRCSHCGRLYMDSKSENLESLI